MRIASVADVKAHFSAFLRDSENGPVVVTRNGSPVAVILPVHDEDEIERLALAYSPKFQSILTAAREDIRQTGGIRHEDFWRDILADGLSQNAASEAGGPDMLPRQDSTLVQTQVAVGEGRSPRWDNGSAKDD
jgi:prevent-host-death family protein